MCMKNETDKRVDLISTFPTNPTIPKGEDDKIGSNSADPIDNCYDKVATRQHGTSQPFDGNCCTMSWSPCTRGSSSPLRFWAGVPRNWYRGRRSSWGHQEECAEIPVATLVDIRGKESKSFYGNCGPLKALEYTRIEYIFSVNNETNVLCSAAFPRPNLQGRNLLAFWGKTNQESRTPKVTLSVLAFA